MDADGVPTLVEVKRSEDTRGRREVVAQMLDYAANAKVSFSAERMAAWVQEEAGRRGTTGAELLADALNVGDADAFWASVAGNLEAERFGSSSLPTLSGPGSGESSSSSTSK